MKKVPVRGPRLTARPKTRFVVGWRVPADEWEDDFVVVKEPASGFDEEMMLDLLDAKREVERALHLVATSFLLGAFSRHEDEMMEEAASMDDCHDEMSIVESIDGEYHHHEAVLDRRHYGVAASRVRRDIALAREDRRLAPRRCDASRSHSRALKPLASARRVTERRRDREISGIPMPEMPIFKIGKAA